MIVRWYTWLSRRLVPDEEGMTTAELLVRAGASVKAANRYGVIVRRSESDAASGTVIYAGWMEGSWVSATTRSSSVAATTA